MGILDVRLKLRDGKIVNLEMQVGKYERLEYYISKVTAGQLKKGDGYSKIAPMVMILITKENLLAQTDEFHNEFGMLEKTKHFALHDLRTVHIFELPKLHFLSTTLTTARATPPHSTAKA
jgi:predicted transposase/invertase (TIGR01784 family)